MSSDLSEQIEDNAAKPKSAAIDGDRAEQHPLPDQIAADKHLARVGSAARDGLPIRMGVFRPPGAV
jgi:hypothetical protein